MAIHLYNFNDNKADKVKDLQRERRGIEKGKFIWEQKKSCPQKIKARKAIIIYLNVRIRDQSYYNIFKCMYKRYNYM